MELADFAGTPGRAIADPIPARSLSGEKTVIEQYLAALGDALVGQGVVVWLNGHLAGMEWISRREVYATVCTQVVRSYILDAPAPPAPRHRPARASGDGVPLYRWCQSARSRGMDSVGLGRDIRYTGEDGFVGSCLMHEDEVIHAGFYPVDHSTRQRLRSQATRWTLPACHRHSPVWVRPGISRTHSETLDSKTLRQRFCRDILPDRSKKRPKKGGSPIPVSLRGSYEPPQTDQERRILHLA